MICTTDIGCNMKKYCLGDLPLVFGSLIVFQVGRKKNFDSQPEHKPEVPSELKVPASQMENPMAIF